MYQPAPLFTTLLDSLRRDNFVRLTLSKPRKTMTEAAVRIQIRLVDIKSALHFSFLYKYPTKDVTKNFWQADGLAKIEELMETTYQIANLFTTEKQLTVEIKKRGKVMLKTQANKTSDVLPPERTHDHQKKEWITDKQFLTELGILNASGNIKKNKGDKFRQIRKFVEIVDGLVRQTSALNHKNPLRIVDMGAGKGYLTFALYDYFKNYLNKNIDIRGVEIRQNLIDKGNAIAAKLGYKHLRYEVGFISDYQLPKTDILLALHACDTATDDAIFKGIQANAALIICAPCCHKQVRRAMTARPSLPAMLDYGILKERQAEIVTDTIRALLLEKAGYKTKVFEFISTEHTGKNLMITGQRHDRPVDTATIDKKILALKTSFGVEMHYLEEKLGRG